MADDDRARFHQASALEPPHWLDLQYVVQRRVLRYFRRQGLLDEADAYSMLGWQGSGGFSIDASVRISGHDRDGLERLIRYCARPPFALERLHAPNGAASLSSPDARLLYRFPGPTPDGRTEILLSPLELLERLARFVPPPRVHRNRYHGVLAPNARLRPAVVAFGRPAPDLPPRQLFPPHTAPRTTSALRAKGEPARRASPARIRWAVLLARIYEVLPLLCPACGGTMRILAFLTDPPVVSAILLHLEPGPPRNACCVGSGLPHQRPPISPARGPPQGDFLLDQTPGFDPTDTEPVPDFVFDPSLPEHFDA